MTALAWFSMVYAHGSELRALRPCPSRSTINHRPQSTARGGGWQFDPSVPSCVCVWVGVCVCGGVYVCVCVLISVGIYVSRINRHL
jgi:hypothetical protein